MVWFQCEDCGDNLKKPKLPNHFRTCSAQKLSCIDCGQIFGRDTVQDHTQCITEAEKYGPKGQGKTSNVTAAKPIKDAKNQPQVDINVGLSERPPWYCSLCNTKATSKQTLLLHAEGKKHKAKARAFHAANQMNQAEKPAPDAKLPVENGPNDEVQDDKYVKQPNLQDPSEHNSDFKSGNETSPSKKKRKLDALEDDPMKKKSRDDTPGAMGNGEVIQGERAETAEKPDVKKKIKWKKFIKSALKSYPDGTLKLKKLRKLVNKALQEYGIVVDENELKEALQQQITSSSRFAVENKYVRLVDR